MADASTRSFVSQWTYGRSQDRESLQNEDAAAQWRSVERVAVRKWQRQQHQLEHEDHTAMDFGARVHALGAHFRQVRRRESPAGSPTPSVQGTPRRRSRPQSASIHRRALDDVAAATNPQAVRLRPQSAKASRPERIAPTETQITRKLPTRQDASKWTEMLARGPEFKQLNLRLLELETYELLRHALLKQQPGEKKPRSRRRRRRDSGDKGAKPGDATVACGSGLQLARSRKQRQQEHDKRMMLGQDRRPARRSGGDRAIASQGQGPQVPVEEKRLIQEKTRRRSQLLKKKSQKRLEQPQDTQVANQEQRSPPVALLRPLSARRAVKATRPTSARATKAAPPETAGSRPDGTLLGFIKHADTKISPAKRADAAISNPPVERVEANPALGSSASGDVGRRDKHSDDADDPQGPPVSASVQNELLSSTFESELLLDSALLLSIPQCEVTGERASECEPTASPSSEQRTPDSDGLLLARLTKDEGGGDDPASCGTPCDLTEPRRDLGAPEPADQASFCIDAGVERLPAQQLDHLDSGSDLEGLNALVPQPTDWNPPENDPSDGSQAQVAATIEDLQDPVALRGSDCSNSMVKDPIETWSIKAEELSSPEHDNGLVQTSAAVLTDVPDFNSNDGEPSILQGREDGERVGGLDFSEQLIPRATAFETANEKNGQCEEGIEPRRRRPLISDEGAAVARPSQLPYPASLLGDHLVRPDLLIRIERDRDNDLERVEASASERYTWSSDEDQEEAPRMASDEGSNELLSALPPDEDQSATAEHGSLLLVEDPDLDADWSEAAQALTSLARIERNTVSEDGSVKDVDDVHDVPGPEVECSGSDVAANQSASPLSSSRDSSLLASGTNVDNALAVQDEGFQMASAIEGASPGNGSRLPAPVPAGEETWEGPEEVQSDLKSVESKAEIARLQAVERPTAALLDDEDVTATDASVAASDAGDPVLAKTAEDTEGPEELAVDKLQQGHDEEGVAQLHVPLAWDNSAVDDTPTTTDTKEDAERGLQMQQAASKDSCEGALEPAAHADGNQTADLQRPTTRSIIEAREQQEEEESSEDLGVVSSVFRPRQQAEQSTLDPSEASIVCSQDPLPSPDGGLLHLAADPVLDSSEAARSELEAADEKPQVPVSSRLPDDAPARGGSSGTLEAPDEDADRHVIGASAPASLHSATSNRSATPNATEARADSVAVPPTCEITADPDVEEKAPTSTLEKPLDLRDDAVDSSGNGSDVPAGSGPSWLLKQRKTSEDTRLQASGRAPPAALLDEEGVMAAEDMGEREGLAVAELQPRAQQAAHKEDEVQPSLVAEDRPAIRPDLDEEAERDLKSQPAAELHRAACRIQAQYRCFMQRRLLLDQLHFLVAKQQRKARKKSRHKAKKAVACPPTASAGSDELLLATGASEGVTEAAKGRKDSCEYALDFSMPNADSSGRQEDGKGHDDADVASPVSPLLQQVADAVEKASDAALESAEPLQSTAAPAWQTFVDEASGQSYYYNAETGESCWELPATAPAPALASPWAEYTDPQTQAPYYVNLQTLATSWERPAELLDAAAEAEEAAYEIAIALS